MSDKALSLATLLEEPLVAGTTINMIAPTNPATVPPGGAGDADQGTGGSDTGGGGDNSGGDGEP
jgi:hypothetical protein